MIWTIILGLVQATTEFLPISSSAHLLILPWLFGGADKGLAFDASLHIGTAIALVIYFWPDFISLIKKRDRMLRLILIASIPGGVIGFFGEKLIESLFHDGSAAILIAAIGMLLTTIVIWQIDTHAKLNRRLDQMGQKQALAIGLAQALALVPGTSRSGATIAAALAFGYDRASATRFSFLLGTPIALGAGLYKLKDIIGNGAGLNAMGIDVLLGIVVSAIGGFIVIRWLLQYVQRHSLRAFLLYRLGFSLIILLVWLWRS